MVALGERVSPTGQELLAEFIQYGHQRPFEEIVRRYSGMVFNVCFRITKDKHEAEDAVQAVFLTLALQAKRGTEIKALGPWLQQVAKRLALDIRRSKKRRKTREERHHTETTIRREQILGDALPSADMDELKTILHEELQKLPAKYRLPLILHYFGGLNRDEMAAELNCKASTLGVRIFRGREMLAGRLSGRGINISSAALAMLLGYAIKRAVSDSLIASTSHAATAMMAGYDGSHLASANVIGLTRRATNAMALGKVKMSAIALLIAGTSLGAGAKALQILPAGTLQRMISNQIRRLVQPILQPITQPMLSQAPATTPAPPTSTDTGTAYIYTNSNAPAQTTPTQPTLTHLTAPVVNTTPSVVATNNTTKTQSIASGWTTTYIAPTPPAPVASGNSAASSGTTLADAAATTGSTSSGGGATGGSAGGLPAFAAPAPAASRSYGSNSAAAQFADVVIGTNSLTIASAARVSGTASSGTAVKSNTSSLTQSPTATILVPSTMGTITETNTGELRGWGTPTESGSLTMAGVAVADGDGINRTLDLTHFSSIQTTVADTSTQTASAANTIAVAPTINTASTVTKTTTPITPAVVTTSTAASTGTVGTSVVTTASAANSAGYDEVTVTGTGTTASTSKTADPGSVASIAVTSTGATGASTTTMPPRGTIAPPLNGWYAIDHGRLCMNLEQSTTSPNVLTWGDNVDGSLSLINSVRLSLSGNSSTALPSQLSLLSPDRDDAMNLSQITGTTIGLWKVDPAAGAIADANLEVHYDTLFANALGADPSSIDLWALNAQTDQWSSVNPDTLVVDTTDNLVFGSAEDFSAFAVSVIPAPGANIDFIRAHQLAMINDGPLTAHHDDAMPGGIAALPSAASPSAVSSIPEPVGLPLLAVGLGLLGRRRRK